jgi:large repetitive protein
MNKIFTKSLIFSVLITIFSLSGVFGQTLTIGSVDPGPYGPGSTIAVPFHIDDSGGCIQRNNVFSLYLCNASGMIIQATALDTIRNFYGTYFNYTVPSTLAAGTYSFVMKSSSPAITSAASGTITVGSTAGSTASVICTTAPALNSSYPNVYGACSGTNNTQYNFNNNSSSGTTTDMSVINESTQTKVVTNSPFTSTYSFTAQTVNYTMIVRAINGSGVVSTYGYQLINNVVNTSIGATGNPSVCLVNGSAPLTYNIDVSSSTGIQNNYPGNTYTFTWGDGSSSIYTLCQIKALNGQITHNYTQSSCGQTANNNVNSFEIDFKSENDYCGKIGSAPSNYAKVFVLPVNLFKGPTLGCTGSTEVFQNQSAPGPDPNATISSCSDNPKAVYNWLVDGMVIATGYHLNQNFSTTFTKGTHTITLHLENPGACAPQDYSATICVQDPPTLSFTVPQNTICIGSGPLVPVNTSIVDASCNSQNTYAWVVSPSTGVTYNPSATQPSISFTNTGVYTISLGITTASCGAITDPNTATVVVNATPVATLSKDFSTCGKGQTYNFNATQTNNPTYTILTGTGQQQPNTYTWTVSGGSYSFSTGDANSQYPGITFNDYGIYTITVTQQNSCGTATSTQHITFQQAPTVNAGNSATICAGTSASLNGTITGTGVTSYGWTTSGSGTFTPSANVLNPQYQPSAADINAGSVLLTLSATTNVAAPCNIVTSSVTISITPYDKVTSAAGKSICSNSNVNYTITGLAASSTFTWTAALVAGNATGFSATGSGSLINDLLVNTDPTSTTNAIVAYTITPYSSSGCPGTPFTLDVTVTPLPILTATVPNAVICSNQPANIGFTTKTPGNSFTWTSTTTGTVSGNSQQATPISISGIQDILVNNGTTEAKVTYTITPYSSSGCAGTPVTAVINVQPLPVQSNAGPDVSICNTNSYTLQGNNPSPGTGKWTVVNGSSAVFADDTQPNTTVNGLIPGNVYEFEWTITAAPGCQSESVVTVTVDAPSVAGTTAAVGSSSVCAGTNNGQINLTGQTGQVLGWQQSTDNGATYTPVVPTNTTTTLLFTNLTQTTLYEAIVKNGSCTIATSSPTTITVNQPAITANAGNSTSLCNAATYTLQGNDPGTFTAQWTQTAGPPVTFADPTKYNTTISNLQGGNVYEFTWTINATSPCTNSQSQVVITDAADVVGSFTADKKDFCGSQTVTFTNTSNNQSGASFSWDFGDGTTSTAANPQHQFQQTVNGHDTTYIVSLSVLNNCTQRGPVFDTITVRPAKPLASILPQSTTGCTPFTITVQNTTPGNNPKYQFFIYNGTTLVQEIDKTDKSNAVFNPINVNSPTIFNLYMIATGYCGATDTTNILPIQLSPPTVTPQMFVQNNNTAGCAPFSTTFINNSQGGTSYHYNIYDSNNNLITQLTAGTSDFPYTFNTPGTYYVSISAANNCSPTGVESAKIQIIAYPVPQPSFTTATDCSNKVTFNNTTPDNGTTPASSLLYDWNFGDGSPDEHTFIPQPHSYNYTKSPFTVTMTATDPVSGCSNTTTQPLNVGAPLAAEFTEQPDSITSIPNYHFSFTDRSTGAPISWVWTFGDGNSSTAQDPEYTYPDTGLYAVQLVVTNKNSCTSTITHYVRITGVPGQLFLPNAFIPTSGVTELRTFMAKGSGIKTWHMQIFNNYGQLVWETVRLSEKGEPVDGWDGTFKGTPAPQGAYTWQVSAIFINGTQWTGMSYNNGLPRRTGTVNLIR